MEIEISKESDKKLSEISEELGIDKEEIVNRAILLYMDSIEKLLLLKKEMNIWDKLSDEALEKFEMGL
jgi:hypothetical protein